MCVCVSTGCLVHVNTQQWVSDFGVGRCGRGSGRGKGSGNAEISGSCSSSCSSSSCCVPFDEGGVRAACDDDSGAGGAQHDLDRSDVV